MAPEADEALHAIALLIAQDEKYVDREWDAMSLVAIVTDTSVDMTGFSYVAGEKPKPGTPRNGDIMDQLVQFRQLKRRDGNAPWKAVLIQIVKAEMRIGITFEYDDAQRWKVTPDNLVRMREKLRPFFAK
ncbi:hypothetical protein [Roseobacter sp. MH60115]|uniref:hypothetical protein n=1 Tax=Roseobacter sp. MH60115 TaxID=2785324 RepID=UPI0018A27702|nr:hypothetical protein [Roseobacter sp. MH60115]